MPIFRDGKSPPDPAHHRDKNSLEIDHVNALAAETT
jgi:hypothetical protein